MSPLWNELVKMLKEGRLLKEPEAIDPNKSFQELGLDSLDLAGIFLAMEENFHVKLLDNPAKRPQSFREALTIIERDRAQKK